MISCNAFRARFHAATEDAELLVHVRACDACLDFAAGVDPDVLFRAIGGGEMIPPGGVDAFVGDVMREVHLRATEKTAQRVVSWPRRLAVAATLAAGITGSAIVWQLERATSSAPAPVSRRIAAASAHPVIVPVASKPVIEKYDSASATIVEMPTTGANDAQIVMIIDDKLPADL
jgi:hypothetical protein